MGGEIVRKESYSFDFMDMDTVVTSVTVYDDGSVDFVNYTDDIVERAFGCREKVDSIDVYDFFASRCMPPGRPREKEVLAALGLTRYNPIDIARKNYSRRIEDTNWVRFKGVTKTFEEVDKYVFG